jgi:DNA repair protein SbcD/Mre11
MKYAHFADCHIGGWKEEKLRDLNLESFRNAISICIGKNVDFVLISGDLFNTALPQIDFIKEATKELRRLRDKQIPVYMVPGSHDYSPSGKTMLKVLEKAKLIINVVNFNEGKLSFVVDPKTNAKITGLWGKKGGLEKSDYEELNKEELEREEGYKIFMFHTAIDEFKPPGLEEMPGESVASLPNNFNYYAGGHVHYIFKKEYGNGYLTFPGALFPNNFKELEEWKCGGLYLVEDNNLEYIPIQLKDVVSLVFDVNDKSPEEAKQFIINELRNKDVKDKIVTLRVRGDLNGRVSELKFKDILEYLGEAFHVLKNTAKLKSKTRVKSSLKDGSVEEIEKELVKEVECEVKIKDFSKDDEIKFTEDLMLILDKEREEGEKVGDFEKRVVSEVEKVMDL